MNNQNRSFSFLAFLLCTLLHQAALGQCILQNPSFEVSGSGSSTFGGWNESENVGSSSDAIHGLLAARVTGPDLGHPDHNTSAYWQALSAVPGEQWEISVWVKTSSVHPLIGTSHAFVNIEWHDGNGNMTYSSYTVATPDTPTEQYQEFTVVSQPAPAGTETIHFLLGVYQDVAHPAPDVFYDQATIFSQNTPTMHEQQWADFPGGRTVDFSGYTWRVKGPGEFEPGPNGHTKSFYSDANDCVWVDPDDQLHLTIRNNNEVWSSTEVALEDALGYGDYIFTTVGRLDLLDPGAVLGLFLWQYGPCYNEAYLWWNPYNEIDIEFSRWGDPSNQIGQFVAQPSDSTVYPGNLSRFDATFSEDEITSHAFRWLPDCIGFRSWRGGPSDESAQDAIHTWGYTGPHIPRPEQPRVHLNLWQFQTPPASNQEVVISEFTFISSNSFCPVMDQFEGRLQHGSIGRLFPAIPNPFNAHTTIRFFLEEAGGAEITIYDVFGRRVRSLASGNFPAGESTLAWNGRDENDAQVASGIYFYRLRSGGGNLTRRMTLVK